MKRILFLLLVSFLSGCGEANTGSSTASGSESPSGTDTSDLGTQTNLTFLFTVQTDSEVDDTLDFAVVFPSSYIVPLYVQSNGTISFLANEFPRMVFRACANDSPTSDCHTYLDDLDIDIDLVIDACGEVEEDENCGEADTTVYSGTLSDDGSMNINAVSIRIRLFAVTDNLDGYTADDTDTGLMTLSRLIVRITTGAVQTGGLTETGSRLNNKAVKLVGGGLIPDDMPTLGGAHYVASMTGSFDGDPLALLE